MSVNSESSKECLRPDFDRSIMMDFRGAKLSSDTVFILMRKLYQRHNVISPMDEALDDKSWVLANRLGFSEKSL